MKKRLLSLCLSLLLITAALPFAAQAQGEGEEVSDQTAFFAALENARSADGVYTVKLTESFALTKATLDSQNNYMPIVLPQNLIIEGDGSQVLTSRLPLLLGGDNVVFKNFHLVIIAEDKTVYLAGHSLCLDGIKTADANLRSYPFNIYGGGFHEEHSGAVTGENASLELKNLTTSANAFSLQSIVMGSAAPTDSRRASYTGRASIISQPKLTVIDGVDTSECTQATVKILDADSKYAQNVASSFSTFYGGSGTELILSHVLLESGSLYGIGKYTLENGAQLKLKDVYDADLLTNISLADGSALNLFNASENGVGAAVNISGNISGSGTVYMLPDTRLAIGGKAQGEIKIHIMDNTGMTNRFADPIEGRLYAAAADGGDLTAFSFADVHSGIYLKAEKSGSVCKWTAAQGESKPEILTGDINSDGEVNAADVTLLQKYLVLSVPQAALNIEACDVNSDGAINVKDATAIQKIIIDIALL